MNSNQVKAFFKSRGLKVRVRTTPTLQSWITAWIPCEPRSKVGDALVYTSRMEADFMRCCLRAVYGDTSVGNQAAAGNVTAHSIAMLPREWEAAVWTFTNPELLAAVLNTPVTTPR